MKMMFILLKDTRKHIGIPTTRQIDDGIEDLSKKKNENPSK